MILILKQIDWIKKNPRAFYSYLNKQSKSRSNVGPLKDNNDKAVSDDLGMASLLNDFFSSVFNEENVTAMPVPDHVFHGEVSLRDAHICPSSI